MSDLRERISKAMAMRRRGQGRWRCGLVLVVLTMGLGCAGANEALKPSEASEPGKTTSDARPGSERTEPETERPGEDILPNGRMEREKGSPAETPGAGQEVESPPALEESSERASEEARPEIPKTAPPDEEPPESGESAAKAETTEAQGEPAEDVGRIDLNFDDADLYEVIRVLAELLNMNYIVDPNVRGSVTIHTAGKLNKRDLLPVFYQILEANGLTAVKRGNLYHILPLKDASRMPLGSRIGREGETAVPEERMVIQIVPLQYISAQEMSKLLTPFISSEGTIISHDDSNTLVVVDKGVNMGKILGLVDVFDVDTLGRIHHRVYPLLNMDAEEMAKILTDVFAAYGAAGKDEVKFVGIERLNRLLVFSTKPEAFQKVEAFIRQLDVAGEEASPRIYVYYVKNGKAKDLADILKQVFEKRSDQAGGASGVSKDADAGGFSRNPLSQDYLRRKEAEKEKKESAQPAAKAPGAGGEESGSGTLKEEVKITADEVRNALIIEAIPSDFRIIQDILSRLDILPRQVLIDATIAEVNLDTATQLGVKWGFGTAVEGLRSSYGLSLGQNGLQYAIGVGDKWHVELEALASKGRVNLLSSPHVLASDNKEAKIDISDEIPVASSQYRYATEESVTETTIQYRDTGVLLSVTPHINERGLVTMDINLEVSEKKDNDVRVAGVDYPAFFKRTATTTLTVKHGQTLAIGGIVSDKADDSIEGTPCLIDMPILRLLAGRTVERVNKKELIILITPRVIVSLEDVEEATGEFKDKVKNALESFERLRQ